LNYGINSITIQSVFYRIVFDIPLTGVKVPQGVYYKEDGGEQSIS